jgi:hypothetical protein
VTIKEMIMDFSKLAEKLKEQGLDLAEDAAVLVVEAVFSWAEEQVSLSENKYDDLLLVVLPIVKPMLLAEVDKIDGKEG